MAVFIKDGDVVGLTCGQSLKRIPVDAASNLFKPFILRSSKGGSLKQDSKVILTTKDGTEAMLLSPSQIWKLKVDADGPLKHGASISFKHTQTGQYLAYHQDNFLASDIRFLFNVFTLISDPVEHVVVLMFENRSFFRTFGHRDPKRDTYVNVAADGSKIVSAPTTMRTDSSDPPHNIPDVATSLNGKKSDGFVKAFENAYKGQKYTKQQVQDIMGYYPEGFLPSLHQLQNFTTVCSSWYSSLPGPTWPNRMFAISGSSFGWTVTPGDSGFLDELHGTYELWTKWQTVKLAEPQKFSIFDILNEKGISYGAYTDDLFGYPLTKLLYSDHIGGNYSDIDSFFDRAAKGTLPVFSFLEPALLLRETFGGTLNSDHPPEDPILAQEFIAQVYEVLRTSPQWSKTLLVITYDEHGGFYDPVSPPSAPVPDKLSAKEAAFGRFGCRVPTLLVSPCAKAGVDDTVYDHTSVLRYVLGKWAPDAIDQLGQRVFLANPISLLNTPRAEPFPQIIFNGQPFTKDSRRDKKIDPREATAIALARPEVSKAISQLLVGHLSSSNTHSFSMSSVESYVKAFVGTYFGGLGASVKPQPEHHDLKVNEHPDVTDRKLQINAVCEYVQQTRQGHMHPLQMQYVHMLRAQADKLANESMDKVKHA